MSGETVAVAMSGGVDSSVAAALLLDSGVPLMGLTMLNSGDGSALAAAEAAAEVARHLGIEHHVVDLTRAFRREVLSPCWEEYAGGRTPNPCVICNPRIKFGRLLEAARGLGATALATGHHARLVKIHGAGAPLVARGRDPVKDQSYFLAMLTAEQRAAARFPIGAMTKEEVRRAARALELPSSEAPESQDTCVVLDAERGREGAFAESLRRWLGGEAALGDMVDPRGRVLGCHDGVHLFTVGQRRGLGVSLGRRAYVVRIDGERRQVVISTEPDDLKARQMLVDHVLWSVPARGDDSPPLRCLVQIRSRHRAEPATVEPVGDDGARVRFDDPVSAITPGQAAVFYRDELVFGAGRIKEVDLPTKALTIQSPCPTD